MRKTSLVLATLLAVAGICVMLWPTFTGSRLESHAEEAAQTFLEERRPEQQYPELLVALREYNQRIYTDTRHGTGHACILGRVRRPPRRRRCGAG